MLFFLFSGVNPTHANGINRTGVGAKSMGRGGAAVSSPDDSFAGMAVNPSLLSYFSDSDFSVSTVGVIADGNFAGRAGSGSLDQNTGLFPELVVRHFNPDGLSLGFSVIPEQARLGDWIYTDAPGGIDGKTSYGLQRHQSRVEGVRLAMGTGLQVTDTLSVGASVGLLYNRNRLNSPYTFQSHPALAGMKTLLDLETDGVGLNADIGMTWTPTERVTLGLAYRSSTRVKTEGSAEGDIGEQLRALGLNSVPGKFEYDAEVINHLPGQLTFGGSLRISDRTSLHSEIEWVQWSQAFDALQVDLTNGSNPAINGLLDSSSILDTIPLDWEDRIVYRVGIEHRLCPQWSIRGGYQYGKSPIPEETLLPMTAAISEHTLTFGISWENGPTEISLAYQKDLPSSAEIRNSRILSGEYSGSRVDLEATWIALTVRHEY